jgi:predicted DNA-binding transcriptional regulator YafY
VLAREVADEFGVSLRTVYRDMRALSAAGFPVEGSAGDGYRVPQTSYLRPLALTADEAEALTLAARAFGAVAAPPLRDALTRATLKLDSVLDAPTRLRVLELQKRIVVPSFVRGSGLSPELLASLRERRVARIRYRDPRTQVETKRSIEALGLVCAGDAWWLIAYCRLRRDARAFRLDRIAEFRMLEETHVPRADYALADVIVRDRQLAKALFGS